MNIIIQIPPMQSAARSPGNKHTHIPRPLAQAPKCLSCGTKEPCDHLWLEENDTNQGPQGGLFPWLGLHLILLGSKTETLKRIYLGGFPGAPGPAATATKAPSKCHRLLFKGVSPAKTNTGHSDISRGPGAEPP